MDRMCRNELGYHPINVYLNITCALCYIYTFHSADERAYPLTYADGGFLARADNTSDLFLPTAFNRSSPVFTVAFPGEEMDHDAQLWRDCCQAAADCCQEQLKRNASEANLEESCPATWDGWQCWNRTEKGRTTTGSCPRHINPVSSPVCSVGAAEKTCTADGIWFRHETVDEFEGNFSKEWTNYTGCFNLAPLEHRYQMHIVSYCISILFLVPAILIFGRCTQLHVQRNMIHLNFFLSLFMYAVMLIVSQTTITHKLFENPEALVSDSSSTVECRLVYTLTMYLRLCNYCWMFCEGLFLLRHLKHVFMMEQRFWLYLLGGWGFPAFPVTIYISLRSGDAGCWMEPKDYLEWILKAPALITLGLNFLFLWYIVCLLLRKLQTQYVSEVEKFRKSCRAVLVLLPLFGLHFVITGYRPTESCGWQWYFLLNIALDGLQGFFVSLTFCYSNSEVIALGKRTFYAFHNRRSMLHRSVSSRSGGSSGSGATFTGMSLDALPPSRSISTTTRMTWAENSIRIPTVPPRTRKKGRVQLCRFESLVERQPNPESRNLLRFYWKDRRTPSPSISLPE